MAKNSPKLSPLLLAVLATLLLTAGWLMASFPLLIFFGLAPLMAVAESKDKNDSIFEKMELVLLILAVAFMARAFTHHSSVVMALVSAIGFTLAFVAHAWVRQALGIRAGKITLIIFWLAVEYVFLKVMPSGSLYLADTLSLQGDWTRWTPHTGYLGASLWILLVNACWYMAFLQETGIRWGWMVAGILLMGGPLSYSYTLAGPPITREIMINLYENLPADLDVTYLARGEWVVRTAAWLSTLILIFTFVKHQTKKK